MLGPIIAILRGLTPEEAPRIGAALVAAGVRTAEVPLNRPGALESLFLLQNRFGDQLTLGAGTVLTPAAVQTAAAAGARFIVSPNCDPAVIRATRAAGLLSMPGVFTATEAFAALSAGADALKLFPADALGHGAIEALTAVMPAATAVFAVGGVAVEDVAAWRRAGAAGLGVGGSLYRPGCDSQDVERSVRAFVEAWDQSRP